MSFSYLGFSNSHLLRSVFILLSSAGNAGNQDSESNRVQISVSVDDNLWAHGHGKDNLGALVTSISGEHSATAANHGHTVSTAWINHTPNYYALTFIELI